MKHWVKVPASRHCGGCCGPIPKDAPALVLTFDVVAPRIRCVACAKAVYGQDVPVPFPEPDITAPTRARAQDFVTAGELARSSRYKRPDVRQRQTGEEG